MLKAHLPLEKQQRLILHKNPATAHPWQETPWTKSHHTGGSCLLRFPSGKKQPLSLPLNQRYVLAPRMPTPKTKCSFSRLGLETTLETLVFCSKPVAPAGLLWFFPAPSFHALCSLHTLLG